MDPFVMNFDEYKYSIYESLIEIFGKGYTIKINNLLFFLYKWYTLNIRRVEWFLWKKC